MGCCPLDESGGDIVDDLLSEQDPRSCPAVDWLLTAGRCPMMVRRERCPRQTKSCVHVVRCHLPSQALVIVRLPRYMYTLPLLPGCSIAFPHRSWRTSRCPRPAEALILPQWPAYEQQSSAPARVTGVSTRRWSVTWQCPSSLMVSSAPISKPCCSTLFDKKRLLCSLLCHLSSPPRLLPPPTYCFPETFYQWSSPHLQPTHTICCSVAHPHSLSPIPTISARTSQANTKTHVQVERH